MRATAPTPGTQLLTAGMSIMKAHTRSGGAGTVMRCSISTCASVYTHRHGPSGWSATQVVLRRASAHYRRYDSARWERPDESRLVRVSRRSDLAQWRAQARLGQAPGARPAGHLIRAGPQEHVPLGADPGATRRYHRRRRRRSHRAAVPALYGWPVSQSESRSVDRARRPRTRHGLRVRAAVGRHYLNAAGPLYTMSVSVETAGRGQRCTKYSVS